MKTYVIDRRKDDGELERVFTTTNWLEAKKRWEDTPSEQPSAELYLAKQVKDGFVTMDCK